MCVCACVIGFLKIGIVVCAVTNLLNTDKKKKKALLMLIINFVISYLSAKHTVDTHRHINLSQNSKEQVVILMLDSTQFFHTFSHTSQRKYDVKGRPLTMCIEDV